MSNTVMIPKKLLKDIFILIKALKGEIKDIDIKKLVTSIDNEVNKKVEALERRKLYTAYKTATTEEEREKARQEYLNKVGLNKDFRY